MTVPLSDQLAIRAASTNYVSSIYPGCHSSGDLSGDMVRSKQNPLQQPSNPPRRNSGIYMTTARSPRPPPPPPLQKDEEPTRTSVANGARERHSPERKREQPRAGERVADALLHLRESDISVFGLAPGAHQHRHSAPDLHHHHPRDALPEIRRRENGVRALTGTTTTKKTLKIRRAQGWQSPQKSGYLDGSSARKKYAGTSCWNTGEGAQMWDFPSLGRIYASVGCLSPSHSLDARPNLLCMYIGGIGRGHVQHSLF